ncbi:MAG: DUF1320 domain-containing protein [Archaeoglobus sp.]|nr:DUF1320 domain-containing protein [Archaeoglobus sp.]
MYCTIDDIKAKYGTENLARLTGDPSGQNIDEEKINSLISEVSDVMNGYIGKQYNLPLSSIPGILRKICVDLVWLELKKSSKAIISDQDQRTHDAMMKMLRDISEGKLILQINTTVTPKPEVTFQFKPRLFGRPQGYEEH